MSYFDYAATTPIDHDSLEVFTKVSKEFWGNPSSLHEIGGKSEGLLQRCRETLADILHVPSKGIYFTSGGTEGNHLALLTLGLSRQDKGKHIILSSGEHSSLHSSALFLEKLGFTITRIPLTSQGLVDVPKLKEAITNETTIVSIGHINGEIGSIQPLKQIKALLDGSCILLHSDMVQSFGKLPLEDVTSIVDSFTVSSHKIYGPKGVGAVYINPSLDVYPYLPEQTHEGGYRGGTVNVPGIAGFVTAASKFNAHTFDHYKGLRQHFFSCLDEHLPGKYTCYEAPEDAQLPHLIGLSIHGLEGQWLMLECNRSGFSISTGSACQVGKQGLSRTLTSMGVSSRESKEFIRISFGKETTEKQVEDLVITLSTIHTNTLSSLT
ncbi:IscS subfamily cysteine desulfurase [Rossellomorea aquimaris]|uniref:IscS subfamily cysteine desulfurase n=1 Tax=Rossellomorea aquimaris TaxID=189382 RepID=UPI0007D08406|nr:IscS subfamily cysteine desulfurase [Rossellomorea aquimaris]